MSVACFAQCMRLRLEDPTKKLVLLAFADHVNEDGLTFPSVDLVAAEALCSGRTVQRIIQNFLDVGLLTLHRRASGRGYPTCYRVHPEALGPVPEYWQLREAQRKGSHPATAPKRSERPDDDPQRSLLPEKGDSLVSPLAASGEPQKGDTKPRRGDRSGQKGDTLMSSEPRTYNLKEPADAGPVDNSRPTRPRENNERAAARPSSSARPVRPREDLAQPDGSMSDDYRETLQQITEKARAHAIAPRTRFENDFAFRNRVNVQFAALCINKHEARRLNIDHKRPDETIDDFDHRVTLHAMAEKGLASALSPEEARRQALACR